MLIRKLMYLTDKKLPSEDLLSDIVAAVSANIVTNMGSTIFVGHDDHNFILLKQTINCYCKIGLHNLAKKYILTSQGNLIRKKKNK